MKKLFLLTLFILMNLAFSQTQFALAETQEETIKAIQESMRHNLTTGHINEAKNDLETASSNFHSVEIELGLIQTLMQTGEYTHALSAAAHTQAEHSDNSDATIFYAWLLAMGGNEKAARELIEKYPDDKNLSILHTQIINRQLNAASIKTGRAVQLAPFSKNLPDNFIYWSNGILVPDGRHAITPRIKSFAANKIKIRNGLGEVADATVDKNFKSEEVSLLLLHPPITLRSSLAVAPELISGRPIYLIGYPNHNQPLWPHLKIDVLGMTETGVAFKTHARNIEPGCGLYNQSGQLVALTGENNLVIGLNNALEFLKLSSTVKATPQTMDDIYQAALASSLQILGELPP